MIDKETQAFISRQRAMGWLYDCESCGKERHKFSRFCPICGCLDNRLPKPIVDDSPLQSGNTSDHANGWSLGRVLELTIEPIARVLKRLLCADNCNKCGRPFLENHTTRLKPNNVFPTRCYMPSCRHIYFGRDVYYSIKLLALFPLIFGTIWASAAFVYIGYAALIAAGFALYKFIELFQ